MRGHFALRRVSSGRSPKPSLMGDENDHFDQKRRISSGWTCSLRWGDFDSHDIERYTRAKFLDYTTDNMSIYPSPTGVMIGIDLAYNLHAAYGNWFPGCKPLMQQAMAKIMKANPALRMCSASAFERACSCTPRSRRSRISNSQNYGELFSEPMHLVRRRYERVPRDDSQDV